MLLQTRAHKSVCWELCVCVCEIQKAFLSSENACACESACAVKGEATRLNKSLAERIFMKRDAKAT